MFSTRIPLTLITCVALISCGQRSAHLDDLSTAGIDAGLQDSTLSDIEAPDTHVELEINDDWRALIDHTSWSVVKADEDPFSDRPETVDCAPGTWRVESGLLDIDLLDCNYLSVKHPISHPVRAGDDLHLVLWHLFLRAEDEPTESHWAVAIDGVIIWEETLSIPADPTIFDLVVPAPSDLSKGSDLVVHLHNHGLNTYKVLYVESRTGRGAGK